MNFDRTFILDAIGHGRRFRDFSRTSFRMLFDLRRQGVNPTTILDVGANRGQFSTAARSLFPAATIHSFEPLPDQVGRLQRLAAADPKWHVHPVALGDEETTSVLHVNRHSQSSSLLELTQAHREAFPTAVDLTAVSVPVRRLDGLLGVNALKGRTLLKIDTQGTELSVLDGARGVLEDVDDILLELSFEHLYVGDVLFDEMLATLGELGYRFVRPVGQLTDPRDGRILQIDGLFERATT